MDNLRSLTIVGNKFIGDRCQIIKKLTRLESLRVHDSYFVENRDLWELTNLKELVLHGCSEKRQKELKKILPNTIILNL
jgi:hypothetical protein